MIAVRIPHCSAASAVTGPIDAMATGCRRSATGSTPYSRTKFRTVDALVKVTTSTWRSSSIR